MRHRIIKKSILEGCIGYFIESNIGSDTVSQIYFNAPGTIYDYKIWNNTDVPTDNPNWNGHFPVKQQTRQELLIGHLRNFKKSQS